jgi:hypothetical protein
MTATVSHQSNSVNQSEANQTSLTKQKHDMTSSGMTIRGRNLDAKTIKRLRVNVDDYISKMSGREFRRCYRMDKELFCIINILDIISPHLRSDGSARKCGATTNGPITHEALLSMALRYCAGGDPLDISHIHGVNSDEVLN